jgi:hypothetical protein
LEISESPVVVSNKTVSVKRGRVDLTLLADQKYPIKGKLTSNGIEYLVVVPPLALLSNEASHLFFAVLVGPDGALHSQVAIGSSRTGSFVMGQGTYEISEPTAKITRETTQLPQQKGTKILKFYTPVRIQMDSTLRIANSVQMDLQESLFSKI